MLGEMAALQVASDRVSVCRTNGTTQIYKDISAGIKVKGVFVNELHVLVWNGAEAECHELDKGNDPD